MCRSTANSPDEHIVQHHVVVAVDVHECDNWAVLPVSTTLASAFEQPMAVATMYRLATMEPLNSGSKGLWVGCSLNQNRYLSSGTEDYFFLNSFRTGYLSNDTRRVSR